MLKQLLSNIPAPFKTFYFIFSVCFFVWMMFFDANDFINQFRISNKLQQLKNEKAYYEEKIIEVKSEKQELFSNTRQIEKFAREKYLMKKKNEDLFIINED
ncbi:MAG: septum formation initiator family protein [Cytophagales bacterium]|nr:MAG: septum formation initiator family protein [Cytophagales bacterium]